MQETILGKTGLRVGRTGFGCIPIQRISYEESTAILHRALDSGITLYDTAHGYTTSQDRLGTAFGHMRDKVVICTKSGAGDPETLTKQLENSLRMLRSDYIDVFQFHNPGFVPRPGGEDGLYDCLLKAKAEGKIRFIGSSYHKRHLALEAVESGLIDTLQYPFSYLSSDEELELIESCSVHNVGILGMKSLCGGILSNSAAAFAFLRQYENVVPIWGIETMAELEDFIKYESHPPKLDDEMRKIIESDKKEFSGTFCRACGYCLPCPANIFIPMCARLVFLMNRSVKANFSTPEWQDNMRRIDECTNCGHCEANCPYELEVRKLLKSQQTEYFQII